MDHTLTPARDVTTLCPACSGHRHTNVGEKCGYFLFECAHCSTIFAVGDAGPDRIHAVYERYYDYSSFSVAQGVQESLARLVRSLEGYRRTSRWLDLGYGEGVLLHLAQQQGWDCYGVEIAPQALEHGRRQGWTVTSDPATDDRFPAGGFDVVTLVEVIEHLPQPELLLRQVAGWLRPGGVLYLTTPNATSFNRRCLGAEWSVFSPPEHLIIWSGLGLRGLLRKSGFHIRCCVTEGLNPAELVKLWPRKATAAPTAVDRGQSGRCLNDYFTASPARRFVKDSVNRVLTLLRGGDTLKITAVRQGNHRTVSVSD